MQALCHFLGHVKKQLPIFFVRFTHQAAKLGEKAGILAAATPCDVVRRLPRWKVWKDGRLPNDRVRASALWEGWHGYESA